MLVEEAADQQIGFLGAAVPAAEAEALEAGFSVHVGFPNGKRTAARQGAADTGLITSPADRDAAGERPAWSSG
ncbi:hypothetical protein GCM10009075_19100 [Sphingomonas trueperi]